MIIFLFRGKYITILVILYIFYRKNTETELQPNQNQCNMTNIEDYKYLKDFLNNTVPEYTDVVPSHWLEAHPPIPEVQLMISLVLLMICIPGNVCQLLVFIAYFR